MKFSATLCLTLFAIFSITSFSSAAEAAAQLKVESSPDSCVSNESSARAALAKATAYLVRNQRSNGSLSNIKYPGLTGLGLWALAGSGDKELEPAIRAAGDFILSCVQPDGGIYRPMEGRTGGGLATYNTAVCLTALSFLKRDDITRVILDARTFLANAQLEGDDAFAGGFGYDKAMGSRRYSDLSNTAFVMEAMRRTQRFEDMRPVGEKKADIDWDAALKFVESLHNGEGTGDSEGGFAYSPADAKAGTDKAVDAKTGAEKVVLRSYGSITYDGLLALVYCKLDRTDPRVRSTLDWAVKHWTVEENPGVGDQGLYFFYDVIGRALSVAGFDVLERSDAPAIEWRAELARKLVSLQRPDGSYVNSNGRFWENDPVLATAYSAISLEFTLGLIK